MADPRSTRRFTDIRNRWFAWGQARNEPCRAPACKLTTRTIRYELRGTRHPAAPHLGHIIPVIDGINPFDESNMRLEHARCNTSAGATLGNRRRLGLPPKGERRAQRRL